MLQLMVNLQGKNCLPQSQKHMAIIEQDIHSRNKSSRNKRDPKWNPSVETSKAVIHLRKLSILSSLQVESDFRSNPLLT